MEKKINPGLLRWLTFYLLLALVILLLVANLFQGTASSASNGGPTPTPTHPLNKKDMTGTAKANVVATHTATAGVDATATAVVAIPPTKSQQYVSGTPSSFSVAVDPKSTIDQIKQVIQTQAEADGNLKHAAFIIAYVGGRDLNNAQKIAQKVEDALNQLSKGRDDPVFTGVAYQSVAYMGTLTDAKGATIHKYDPNAINNVDLEIYPTQS